MNCCSETIDVEKLEEDISQRKNDPFLFEATSKINHKDHVLIHVSDFMRLEGHY